MTEPVIKLSYSILYIHMCIYVYIYVGIYIYIYKPNCRILNIPASVYIVFNFCDFEKIPYKISDGGY